MSSDLGSGKTGGDLFIGLQTPTTDDTTYQAELIHTGPEEGADGDTMLQSTLNDSETMGDFVFPPEVGTEAYERELLNSTQPDEGQIFADPALMNASAEMAEAAKLGISPEQLAADTKTYGAFASAAIAQGQDPAVFAHLVEIAMNTMHMDPSFESMSPQDQNALLEAVLQGKDEGAEEAQGTNKTPAQEAKGNKIKQIRAQMEKLKKGNGNAFASHAKSSGFSSTKFSALANKHMDDIGMPFAGYTPEQRMQVVFELLINETEGKLPNGSIIESVPAQTKKILFDAMKGDITTGKVSPDPKFVSTNKTQVNQNAGGSGGGGGVQSSSTTEKSYIETVSGTGGPTGANPWLASAPMTVFAMVFLEVARVLMQNKNEQSKLQLAAMQRVMAVAGIAVKYEIQQANLAVKNAMAQATAAAAAMGMAILSMVTQVAFAARKRSEPTKPEHVEDDDFSKLSNTDKIIATKAIKSAKQDIKSTTEDMEKSQTKFDAAEEKHKEKKELLRQADQTVLAAEKKFEEVQAKGRLATTEELNGARRDVKVAKEAAAKARADEFAANSEKNVADKELIDAKAKQAKARADADAAGRIHHFHMESDAEFKKRLAKIKAHNEEMTQKSMIGMTIGQASQSVQQLITQTVAAETAKAQGEVQAGKAMVAAWEEITKNSLSQATQAFNANNDAIESFLSALRDLSSMVQRAMSALIK